MPRHRASGDRNAKKTGEPCNVCYCEDGELIGCAAGHQVCGLCLRHGLRTMSGDILVTNNLICGCLGERDKRLLVALAERSDIALATAITQMSTGKLHSPTPYSLPRSAASFCHPTVLPHSAAHPVASLCCSHSLLVSAGDENFRAEMEEELQMTRARFLLVDGEPLICKEC